MVFEVCNSEQYNNYQVKEGRTYVGNASCLDARAWTEVSSATSPNLPSPSSVAWIPQVIKAEAIPAAFAPLISWCSESPTAIQLEASSSVIAIAESYIIWYDKYHKIKPRCWGELHMTMASQIYT